MDDQAAVRSIICRSNSPTRVCRVARRATISLLGAPSGTGAPGFRILHVLSSLRQVFPHKMLLAGSHRGGPTGSEAGIEHFQVER